MGRHIVATGNYFKMEKEKTMFGCSNKNFAVGCFYMGARLKCSFQVLHGECDQVGWPARRIIRIHLCVAVATVAAEEPTMNRLFSQQLLTSHSR